MAKAKEEVDFQSLIDQVNKEYGSNSLVLIGEKPRERAKTINSGSILLNLGLNGGYAEGKIIEAFGDNGSGKTTLALQAIAQVQIKGQVAAFIDMEHALNLDYAEALGVNVPKLFFSQPETGEQALGIAELLIKSGKINFICFDSVAAMIPKAELEGEFGEAKMGLHARLMGQGMRKLTGEASKRNVTLFFINQTREKIGIMFGDPTTTTGGNALKFYSSQRLQVFAGTKVKGTDGEFIGQEMTIKIIKNKIGVPHKKIKTVLIYGKGIDTLGEIIDIAVEMNLIKKAGSWFSYQDQKIGQGMDSVRICLQDNPELLEEIKTKAGI